MYIENKSFDEVKIKEKKIWNRKIFLVPVSLILIFAVIIGLACIRREIQKKEYTKIVKSITTVFEDSQIQHSNYSYVLSKSFKSNYKYEKAEMMYNKNLEWREAIADLKIKKSFLWSERAVGEINTLLYYSENYFINSSYAMAEDKKYFKYGNEKYFMRAIEFTEKACEDLKNYERQMIKISKILGIKY